MATPKKKTETKARAASSAKARVRRPSSLGVAAEAKTAVADSETGRVSAEGAPAPLPNPDAAKVLGAMTATIDGPRAKQLGLPDPFVVRLDVAYFPDSCEFLKSQVGLVFGVAVGKEAIISYSPCPIPQMRVTNIRFVVELGALDLGTLAELQLIFLGIDGMPLGIPAPGRLRCDGGPKCEFSIPVDKFSRLFTAGIRVVPVTNDKRPVVRAAWLEIES